MTICTIFTIPQLTILVLDRSASVSVDWGAILYGMWTWHILMWYALFTLKSFTKNVRIADSIRFRRIYQNRMQSDGARVSSVNLIGSQWPSLSRGIWHIRKSSKIFRHVASSLTASERRCACVLGVSDCEEIFMESLYCEFTGKGANFWEKYATLECATFTYHIESHPWYQAGSWPWYPLGVNRKDYDCLPLKEFVITSPIWPRLSKERKILRWNYCWKSVFCLLCKYCLIARWKRIVVTVRLNSISTL